MIIGIEGPAGAGKTTMAQTVAAEIGAIVVEGGAWYRALTYVAQQEGIDPTDTAALEARARRLDFEVRFDARSHKSRLFLAGRDVTAELYDEKVSTAIAPIAQQLPVRAVLEAQLAEFVRSQADVIFVGRHLRKAVPETAILRLTISGAEAERRHRIRIGERARPVADRNAADKRTAKLIGTEAATEEEVDVTDMSPAEQAELLRAFIGQYAGFEKTSEKTSSHSDL